MLLLSTVAFAQMSDQQVIQFIQAEMKAGTSQAQIVTKLVQKGVSMEQIRRLQKQYASQISKAGATGKVNAAVSEASSRLRNKNEKSNKSGQITFQQEMADDEQMPSSAVQRMDESRVPDSLKVFGHDIFNNKLLSFEPNMNIATPQNYVLGPGDQVIVDVYGASQKSQQLEVSPDGVIVVEGYGPIQVSGLTVAAAQRKLRTTLGSRYKSSSMNVSVGQTRTIMVNVMGEVKAPGTYTLSAFSTVFHALYMAGGINDFIRGHIKRPMIYEMRPTESVAQVIKYAGGFSSDAFKKSVRLVRKSGERYSVHTIEEFDMSGFKVADGDSIGVDAMVERFENMVEVKGAVFRPGQYELGKQISSVRALVEAAGGLTEEAFTGRAVLYRMKQDRTLETQSLDLGGILAGAVPDMPLRNEDMLIIATLSERNAERIVTITGEVLTPGTYPYSERETVEDLILRAGGLTDAASFSKVDVSRRIHDPKAVQTGQEISKNFSFSLKDGLVVDGQQGFMLEPYDVVQVRRSPGFMVPRTVHIEGEVTFEGDFNLSKKNERISDIIKAAGGVTPDAYVKGARLERHMNAEERARMEAVIKAARQNSTSKDSVQLDKLELTEYYAVGIDLEKALANPGGDYDIVVRDSDRIFVPEYSGTVKISGNVLFPNTVSYQAGKDWKYYINQAGGFGYRSRKSHSYIVYQNGTVTRVGKGKVEPGCEIVVPQKGKRDMSSIMQWVSMGTSLTSLAAMVIALTRR